MKFFAAGVIILIGWIVYQYHRQVITAVASTGNTSVDANKNLNLGPSGVMQISPNNSAGTIFQQAMLMTPTDIPISGFPQTRFLGGATFPEIIAEGGPIASDSLIVQKSVISGASPMSYVAPVRGDLVAPIMINSDINVTSPVEIIGSRYGQNLGDASLQLQMKPPIMQTAAIVPVSARNDSPYLQYTSLDNPDNIPIASRT